MPAGAAAAEHRVQSPGRQQYDPRAEAQPPAARAASAKRKQPGGPTGSRMQRPPPAAGLNGHASGSGPVDAAASRATAVTAALQQLTDSGSDGGNGGRFDGGVWHPPGIGAVTRIRAPPLQTGHPAAASRAAEANGSARQPQDGGSPSMCSMPPAPPPPTPQSAPLQLPADLVGFYRVLHARAQLVTLLAACLCRVLKSTRRQHPMCTCPMQTLDVWHANCTVCLGRGRPAHGYAR